MEVVKRLRIACTPDSEDAYYFDAREAGQVPLPEYELTFVRQPASVLNRAALYGEYDITVISSVVYPKISRRYAILSVGASVGRGSGPILVSRQPCRLTELAGRPVGVGGIPTTDWFLLRCLCPEAVPIEMPCDRIADAVAVGELEAGVMGHEELRKYPELGLHRVIDLGAEWCRRNGLPLPLELSVIRRDLGTPAMQRICAVLRRSLRHALEHPRETLVGGYRYGPDLEGQDATPFVSSFPNEDSIRLAGDVRMGLRVLLAQAADLGLAERIPPLDIVEASEPMAPASLHVA